MHITIGKRGITINIERKGKKIRNIGTSILIFLMIGGLLFQEQKQEVEYIAKQFEAIMKATPINETMRRFLPIIIFAEAGESELSQDSLIEETILSLLPICHYSLDQTSLQVETQDRNTFALLMAAESQDEQLRLEEEPIEDVVIESELVGEILIPTNEPILENEVWTKREQQYSYDWAVLEDSTIFQSTFYTVTPNTSFAQGMLDLENLQQDLSIDKDSTGPQILIYHTHSQEAYADSIEGDDSMTVQGVGEELANILSLEYGYEVLHHTGQYDVDARDDAYARALPDIEQILEENPSIEVVIDLHRDAAIEGREMVVDIDGKETAKFMFFNGLSRTTEGEIAYLPNENLQENLAFSFQLQVKAGEYYPGITRKIYVREYRYNMHVNGKTILIELGDTSNTVEEAKNACIPIAHILDMVLSPEEYE